MVLFNPAACNEVRRVELSEGACIQLQCIFDEGELLHSTTYDLSEPL
ncbi:MAG: hypothetical protein ACLFS0_10100 [Bacteroidales bacterium]